MSKSSVRKYGKIGAAAFALALFVTGWFVSSASAATTVVTPTSMQGWRADDTNALPLFSTEQAHPGNASLKFVNAVASDHVSICKDLPAGTTLSQFQQASYDFFKATGSTTTATYNISIDTNGSAPSTDTAGFVSLFYDPENVGNGGPVVANVWHASGELTGTKLWTSTRPGRTVLATPTSDTVTFDAFQAAYPDADALYVCANQGSGAVNATSYVDDFGVQGNFANFEVDSTVQVIQDQQGVKSQVFNHGNNPALGSVKVTSWVDIRRTFTTFQNGTVVRKYEVRSHQRVEEVGGSVTRVQADKIQLLKASGVVLDSGINVVNSGTSEPAVAEQVTGFRVVQPSTSCTSPTALKANAIGSARWSDGLSTKNLTVLSNLTSSKVCV